MEPRPYTDRVKGIPHPIDPPLVWAPLIAAADGVAHVAEAFGAAPFEHHGYALWYMRIAFFTSVLSACGAVLIGRQLAHRALGGAWSGTWAAVAVLFGSSILYYGAFMPSYGHALDAMATAGFLGYWGFSLGRRDLKRYVWLGILLGLAMLIRVQNVATGIALAVEIGVMVVATLRSRDEPARAKQALQLVLRGVLTLGVAGGVFIPQLAAWKVVYGSFLQLPQGEAYTRPGAPMWLELLWAPSHGWLSSTPVAYAGIIGLCLLPRRARVLGAGLLAAVAIQVFLNSIILDWWGSASFGNRRMCSMTMPIVVGLASLLWHMGRLAARAKRIPRVTWHVVALLILGPLVAFNCWSVSFFTSGRAADGSPHKSCCDKLPNSLKGVVPSVYAHIGNPFQFPANAWFAFRHDVSLKRWDQVFGQYPLVPGGKELINGKWTEAAGTWALANAGNQRYMLNGFSAPTKNLRNMRFTTASSACALVPNLMPQSQSLGIWLAPGGASHVGIRYDGDVVGEVELSPGWQRVVVPIDDPPVGLVKLCFEATPGPELPISIGKSNVPIGVAVSDLQMWFAERVSPPPRAK